MSDRIEEMSKEQTSVGEKLNAYHDQKYQQEIKLAKNETQLDSLKEKLWEEFDEAKTPDARYAAALDRLQPFIHNLCTEGHTWVQAKVNKEQVYKRSGLSMEVLPALKPWMEEQIELAIKKGWIVE